jgi:hypothetical protein
LCEQETGGNYIVRSFMIGVLSKHYAGDQIKETQMSGTCSTYCRKEKYIQDFFVGKRDGMRPLGEYKHSCKGSMKMDPKETG